VAKLVSSASSFGHGFLRNQAISRKFLVVFAVLMVSLGAVALVSMSGMRGILGTFDRAAGAYAASKLAGQLEASAARVVAAESTYLRLGGEEEAAAVIAGIDAMKKTSADLAAATAGTPAAQNVGKIVGIIDSYAAGFEAMHKARAAHAAAAADAAKASQLLSAGFSGLAEAAAKGGTLSLIKKSVSAYGAFARLSVEIARFAGSMSPDDGTAASIDLGTLDSLLSVLKSYAELGDVVEQYDTVMTRLDAFKQAFDAIDGATNALCRSDHYNYARFGIPITFFTTGQEPDYHAPTDEVQYIDYDHMSKVANFIRDIAVKVANLDHRPKIDHPVGDPAAPCVQ